MTKLETVFLCIIWKSLLLRINYVSELLPSNSIELKVTFNTSVALSNYILTTYQSTSNSYVWLNIGYIISNPYFNESKKRKKIAKKYFNDEPLNSK